MTLHVLSLIFVVGLFLWVAIVGMQFFFFDGRRARKEQERHPGLLPRETYDRMRDRQHIIDRQRDVARWQ